MSIGKNIKRFREKSEMTQDDLSKVIGVSDKTVSSWEIGTRTPKMGAIQKIADYFGIRKSDLIEDVRLDEATLVYYFRNLSPKSKKDAIHFCEYRYYSEIGFVDRVELERQTREHMQRLKPDSHQCKNDGYEENQ